MTHGNLIAISTTSAAPERTSTDASEEVWIPFAGPVPDWMNAFDKWGVWWQVHVYGVAALFLVIAALSLASVVTFLLQKSTPQRAYFVALNSMVLILALTRAVFMCVDAYNAEETLHPALAYIFLSIGLPCLTSAFYLIFVAWMRATRMKRISVIQKPRTMVVTICAHFVVSIVLDLAAGFTVHAAYLLILCQACFIVWAATLSVLYFYLYYRVYKSTVVNRRRLSRNMSKFTPTVVAVTSDDEMSSSAYDIRAAKYRKASNALEHLKVPLGAKLIPANAILLVILTGEYLAGIFGIFSLQVLSGDPPKPWPWFGYELSLRLTEFALCCTILMAGARPITKQLTKRVSSRLRNSRRKLMTSRAVEKTPSDVSSTIV